MQAQSKLADVANREVPVADFVPYTSHASDHVLKTRDGDYLRIWKLGGIAFEATDPVDILTRHNAWNQQVRSLAAGNFALWTHRCRRRVSDRFTTRYANDFCQAFADRYYGSFAGYRMMGNEQYLTIVYRPNRTKTGRLFSRAGAARRTLADIRHEEREALKVMDEVANAVESGMKPYDPEPLGVYMRAQCKGETQTGTRRWHSRALEFLGFLVNGEWEPVAVPSGPIREALPTSRLFFGGEKIEIRRPSSTRYGALLDLKDYPEDSEPGVLNNLLYGDFEYIETQSFTILDKPSAKEALERQRGQLIAGEDAAGTQIEAMDVALNDLIDGKFVLGEYHYSLAVFGDTPDGVRKNIAKARTRLHDSGFQTALIDLVSDAAWFAQLPGNWKYRPREAKITSRNFCGLSCFHNFATGKRDGNPWGEAVTILKTPSGQPLYMSFHVTPDKASSLDMKALANTLIIGQAGAGKTALEMGLFALAMKYGFSGVLYDKDRGCEIAIRAMGGTYLNLKYGHASGCNPFQLDPTPQAINFWERFVTKLVLEPGESLSAKDETDVSNAVRTVARMDRSIRRLSMVQQLLPSVGENSLHARLAKWCAGGRLGWVFDNPVDRIQEAMTSNQILGFDDTELLDDPEISSRLTMYMLYLTEQRIDGRRFVYVMTEFWKRLDDEVFAEFAKNKQKTIRKQNGFGIFDTQSPADVLNSPIARALVEQTATFFFLPNPRADYDDYVHGFKLTEAEFEIVRNLGESSRMFLFKQGQRSAIGTFDLGGMGEFLDVLSGTTDNVELLDEIRAEVGDDPANWLPVFHERLALRRAQNKRDRGASARLAGGR